MIVNWKINENAEIKCDIPENIIKSVTVLRGQLENSFAGLTFKISILKNKLIW